MKKHAVIRVDPATGEERRYETCTDAGMELGCHRVSISKAAYRGTKVRGYLWRWEDGATFTHLRGGTAQPPEMREPLDIRDLIRHPHKYNLGQYGKGWVSAGRVLRAFEAILGDGWKGCAQELLDGFKAPLNVLLAHVACWYTNQQQTTMDSDRIKEIVDALKQEYGADEQ